MTEYTFPQTNLQSSRELGRNTPQERARICADLEAAAGWVEDELDRQYQDDLVAKILRSSAG
jgi:hypothetical protein